MPANDVEPYLHEGTFGTGAIWRPEDPRNFDMRRLPGVGAILPSLPAEDTHLAQYLGYTYNQGASPSCVWHTISGLQTANERIERRGEQLIFDAMAMHRATGDPNQGRYTGDMLKIAQDQGTLLAGSSKRYRIGSYAFSPKGSPQEFVDTYKAAIVAGYICGIALRLPSNFSAECSGTVLGWNTYHETIGCGYRSTPGPFGSALGKNSWGEGFGDHGFFWIPFELLLWNNWQEGACFINTIIDGIDDDLSPLPKPPTPPEPPKPPTPPKPTPTMRTLVTAIATGGGLEFLKRDKPALTASGGGFSGNLEVTNVVEYEVPPGPNPPTPPNPPNPPEPPTPPTPGTLRLRGQKWRGFGLIVDVSDENSRPVIAVVSATANGAPLPTLGVNGNHGSVVTFNLHGVTGTVALSAQADDGRKGTGEVTV